MKKAPLLTMLLLVSAIAFGQSKQLKETLVNPPSFMGIDVESNSGLDQSSLNNFFNKNLNNNFSTNGVVVVLFTVEPNKTVTNINILNSVSKMADNAVIECIEKSSGYWQPGLVDGNPVSMEKEIHVKFYDEETTSLEEMANSQIKDAVKKYFKGNFITNNIALSSETQEKRSERKYKNTIKLLDSANRFCPEEPSIYFWQACAYEKLGNEVMKTEKLNRFLEMTDPYYIANTAIISINIR